jgi:hypothetical protein
MSKNLWLKNKRKEVLGEINKDVLGEMKKGFSHNKEKRF